MVSNRAFVGLVCYCTCYVGSRCWVSIVQSQTAILLALVLYFFNFKKFANIWRNKTRWKKRNKVWTSANSLFKWRFRSRRRCRLIGTLRNCDGDGKENVKKAIGLMSKTTTLHVHHAFLFISLLFLLNYDVKWPNFKFTWERERQGDKFYHLCLNSGCGPLSSSLTKIPFF